MITNNNMGYLLGWPNDNVIISAGDTYSYIVLSLHYVVTLCTLIAWVKFWMINFRALDKYIELTGIHLKKVPK